MAQRVSPSTALLIGLFAILGVLAALFYMMGGSDADVRPLDAPSSTDDPSPAAAVELEGADADEASGGARSALATGEAEAPASPETVLWTGIVTDRSTGRPIEGAAVALHAGDSRVEGATDGAGRVALEWPVDAAAQLEVEHPAYVGARRPEVELGVELEIALVPSGGIDGSLVSELDLAGTEVRLWSFARTRYRGDPECMVEASEAGSFAFDDLEPGDYAVGVSHPEAPLLFETGVSVTEGERTTLALTLGAGAALAGRVLIAGTPEPIEGASVSVRPERQGATQDVEDLSAREATTGADGRFAVRGLTPGPSEVVVRSPWEARLRERIDLAAEEPGVERSFWIKPPASLAGHVQTAEGAPAAYAHVAVAREEDAREREWAEALAPGEEAAGVLVTTCDAEGAFAFEAVPSAEALLLAAHGDRARSPASQPAFQRIGLAPGEARSNVTILLAAGFPVAGTVTDPEGAPIDGVSVTVASRSGRSWSDWGTATTDASGRFQAAPVPEGAALLTLEKNGYERARVRVTADAEGSSPDEFELTPAMSLSGWVVDRFGFAVPGAVVFASSTPSSGAEQPVRRGDRADEYGRFELDRLFPGEWALTPWASGWQSASPNPVLAHIPEDSFSALVMDPAPRVERSAVSGEVVLRGTGAGVPGLRLDGVRGGSVAIDGSRFRVSGMLPGTTRIIARANGMEPVYYDSIDLAPGAELDLGRRETRRTSAVEVRVVDKQGRPLTRARVQLEILPAASGGWGSGDRVLRFRPRGGGVYRHDSVPRYAWRLRVIQRGMRGSVEVVRIREARQELRVVLDAAKR